MYDPWLCVLVYCVAPLVIALVFMDIKYHCTICDALYDPSIELEERAQVCPSCVQNVANRLQGKSYYDLKQNIMVTKIDIKQSPEMDAFQHTLKKLKEMVSQAMGIC